MQERRNQANIYVNAIMKDERNAWVREEPKIFTDTKIIREFEFADGAVIEYEWQSADNPDSKESFNHRFTLIKTPSPNPGNLENGVIKVISYK